MVAFAIILLLLPASILALVVLAMHVLPILGAIAFGLVGAIAWAFKAVYESIESSLTDAAIERRVEAGMTPEEAREVVAREREERAHSDVPFRKAALVWVVAMVAVLAVGGADYLFGTRLEPSVPRSHVPTSSIPVVGMAESELGDTVLGAFSSVELADSLPGPGGTVLEVDRAYVWEARNGTHDPVLKAYVHDGVVVLVERCNVDVYWQGDFSSYPNRFAPRPEGYVPDGVA